MKMFKRTIGIVGMCQILFWNLPAVALTVGDHTQLLQPQRSAHIEDIVKETVPSDSIQTGDLICTDNNEECIVKHQEAGEVGTIESQPAIVSIYEELSQSESEVVPEETQDQLSEQIEETEAEAEAEAPEAATAPLETIVKVIYIQAPTPASAPSPAETTTSDDPSEISEEEETETVPELPLVPLVEDVLIEVVDQLGIDDFGLTDVLSGKVTPQKGDSTGTWIVYWCLVGVVSYSVTMILFRKAWTEKSRQDVEYALASKRRAKRLHKVR